MCLLSVEESVGCVIPISMSDPDNLPLDESGYREILRGFRRTARPRYGRSPNLKAAKTTLWERCSIEPVNGISSSRLLWYENTRSSVNYYYYYFCVKKIHSPCAEVTDVLHF